jgi:hypothetical protein
LIGISSSRSDSRRRRFVDSRTCRKGRRHEDGLPSAAAAEGARAQHTNRGAKTETLKVKTDAALTARGVAEPIEEVRRVQESTKESGEPGHGHDRAGVGRDPRAGERIGYQHRQLAKEAARATDNLSEALAVIENGHPEAAADCINRAALAIWHIRWELQAVPS